jgi:glutamine amidotransferase
MIHIIDYGLGNILAFVNMYKRLNVPVAVAKTPAELAGAGKLILPGVGAFDHAMQRFQDSGLRETVDRMVQGGGIPVLGICVGMQMLADSSEEGGLSGLGWVPGTVRKLAVDQLPHGTHLPHMGWNDVAPIGIPALFNGLEQDARFYFLHSFYFEAAEESSVIATADYGRRFACAVNHRNVYGVQFHPEKSHHFGARLLKNFADL